MSYIVEEKSYLNLKFKRNFFLMLLSYTQRQIINHLVVTKSVSININCWRIFGKGIVENQSFYFLECFWFFCSFKLFSLL